MKGVPSWADIFSFSAEIVEGGDVQHSNVPVCQICKVISMHLRYHSAGATRVNSRWCTILALC